LILNDVGMIAADTTRTKAYIQALIRNQMFPKYVLLFVNEEDILLPGQINNSTIFAQEQSQEPSKDNCWSEEKFNPVASVQSLLETAKIPYEISPSQNINDQAVIDLISQRPESVFIFSGFGGVLLRKNILDTGKKFLHVHGGYLPLYKGSTTNYYSLLEDNSMGASSIFLTEKIDSGPVLLRRKFPAPDNRKDIDHVFDSAARARVLIDTLQRYIESGKWSFELKNNKGGEVFYIIHPVLKHISILSEGRASLCE
jgi:methionyl-tRNA formyltransferase